MICQLIPVIDWQGRYVSQGLKVEPMQGYTYCSRIFIEPGWNLPQVNIKLIYLSSSALSCFLNFPSPKGSLPVKHDHNMSSDKWLFLSCRVFRCFVTQHYKLIQLEHTRHKRLTSHWWDQVTSMDGQIRDDLAIRPEVAPKVVDLSTHFYI